MGGISFEREVSLNTGKEILAHLDRQKYDVEQIIINRKTELIEKVNGMDIIFLALHGRFGEDGIVQSILETLEIPYTGCGILSSAVCMDKDMSKKIVKAEGISIPHWIMAKNNFEIDVDTIEKIGYPVVVKPNAGGSSVGTYIVKGREALHEAIGQALQFDEEVMIEQYISGDEITCSILNGKMLPVLAIKPNAPFFDYTAKYSEGGADEFVVALKKELEEKVQEIALKCYQALKCNVYARVDLIVKEGIPYVLEVNTLPGMTKNSLLPKSAQAAGISFSQLLDLIIQYSLERPVKVQRH